MYMGNIGPVAGVDLLINAFSKANLSNGKLLIAGSGSKKEDLQRKVQNENLKSITFIDVPDGKVPEVQSMANVMLLPIKKGAASSSIPSKLPAYMFSKKPIISSVDKNTETANVIEVSNCGWVIDPENIDIFANKMKEVSKLIKEELEKIGQNGFDYAFENLSKERNLKKVVNVIQSVI